MNWGCLAPGDFLYDTNLQRRWLVVQVDPIELPPVTINSLTPFHSQRTILLMILWGAMGSPHAPFIKITKVTSETINKSLTVVSCVMMQP